MCQPCQSQSSPEFAQSYETEFAIFSDKETDYCFTEMPVSHFSRSSTAMLQALLALQAKIHLVITSPQPLYSNKCSWLEDSLNSFAVPFNCYFTLLPPWNSVVIKCVPGVVDTNILHPQVKDLFDFKGCFYLTKDRFPHLAIQAYTRHSYIYIFLILSFLCKSSNLRLVLCPGLTEYSSVTVFSSQGNI